MMVESVAPDFLRILPDYGCDYTLLRDKDFSLGSSTLDCGVEEPETRYP
jgi:hypothetical protein